MGSFDEGEAERFDGVIGPFDGNRHVKRLHVLAVGPSNKVKGTTDFRHGQIRDRTCHFFLFVCPGSYWHFFLWQKEKNP